MAGSKRNAQNRAIEGEVLPPTPCPKIPLSNVESVRREASRVYRDMRAGVIPTQDGTRLIYALDRIGRLLEIGQIERDIADLESVFGIQQSQSELLDYTEGEE